MPITNLIVNVSDMARAVHFYTELLVGVPVEATDHTALVDFGPATIELRAAPHAGPRPWQEDDRVPGFRHIGLKVADVFELSARLKTAGVPFRMEPTDIGVGLVIAFFLDPDGTVIEMTSGQLEHMEVHDRASVMAERASGTPPTARFDHVATTVLDPDASLEHYSALGFSRMRSVIPPDHPQCFRIDHLRSGHTVLELFPFKTPVRVADVRGDALGFVAARLDRPHSAIRQALGTLDGRPVVADANGFAWAGR